MILTVELSYYPLHESYEQQVLDFIDTLQNHQDINVKTNGMSTMIQGPYSTVFNLLENGMKPIMAEDQTNVFVAKFLNKEAFDYIH